MIIILSYVMGLKVPKIDHFLFPGEGGEIQTFWGPRFVFGRWAMQEAAQKKTQKKPKTPKTPKKATKESKIKSSTVKGACDKSSPNLCERGSITLGRHPFNDV